MGEYQKSLPPELVDELKVVFDHAPFGIAIGDVTGNSLARANPAFCRMLGYDDERQMIGLKIDALHAPEIAPRIRDSLQEIWEGHGMSQWLLPMLRKDGATIYVNVTAERIVYRGRHSLVGFFHEVTEQKRTMELLRDSEATLRCLFENLPDFVALVDRQGVIRFANRGIVGIELKDLPNKNGLDMLLPEHRQSTLDMLNRVFQTQQTGFIEAQDIFGRWWAIRAVPLGAEHDAENLMIIATDFTEKRMADQAVAKEQRLLRWLLDLHERERQLIAYEIHDGFAQQITGALFQLQGFRGVFERKPDQAWAMFDTTLRLLSRSIDEARRLISGLRPPILDEEGIVEAVEYLICECSRPEGPTIEFHHDLPGGRLAPPLESALYRIIQESLHNACRHSRSPRVRVSLVRRDDSVCVEIRDWGVGFDIKTVEEQRFGLRGIRERIRLLEGRVSIESAPGKGACISVELPLLGNAAHEG